MTEDLFGKKFKLNFNASAISGPDEGPDVAGENSQPVSKPKSAKKTSAKSKPASKNKSDDLSVTQLLRMVKNALSAGVPKTVTVLGEISNLSTPRSGHIYLSLKDSDSQIPAAMFRSAAAKLKFEPEDGMEVLATGRIDVYDAQGKLQLYITRMEPRGTGALELAYKQLLEKLRAEGLFDRQYKKPIPKIPQCICVITSATGAAIRDIGQTLARRWPAAKVLLIPVAVQGDAAAGQIAKAINLASANRGSLGIDTLIIGRGGGSLEDLWCFNEEIVARAIFDCEIPVISGVGHEVETSIADMVADARAATPTAAAELAVPDRREFIHKIDDTSRRLRYNTTQLLDHGRSQLSAVVRSELFANPLGRCERYQQQLDQCAAAIRSALIQMAADGKRSTEKLAHKLSWSLGALAKRKADELADTQLRLTQQNPKSEIFNKISRLDYLSQRAGKALKIFTEKKTSQLEKSAAMLEALSYRRVLKRGYSVTRGSDGKILTSAENISDGQTILTELADGHITSTVSGGKTAAKPKTAAPTPKKRRTTKSDNENLPGLFD